MTSVTFLQYIKDGFKPFLERNKIRLPVILFVDGHGSHLSLQVSEFCSENQIILVALYPNSTHILQPMDVAVFHPLKQKWKDAVHRYNAEHSGRKPLNRHTFPILLDRVFKRTVKTYHYVNGFEACGLFPFNENNIRFDRIIKTKNYTSPQDVLCPESVPQTISSRTNELLIDLEELIPPEKLLKFYRHSDNEWPNDCSKDLYDIWKQIKGRRDAELDREAAIDEYDQDETENNIDEYEKNTSTSSYIGNFSSSK